MEHDLGFNKEGLIGINIGVLDNDLQKLKRKAAIFKEEVEKYSGQSGIVAIANTEAIPGTGFRNSFTVFNLENDESYTVTSVGIDEDYSKVFEIPVTEGTNFVKGLQSNYGAILINETLKRKLGWETINGKELAVHDRKYKSSVIGVLKDVHVNSLNQSIPPMIYLYKRNAYPQYMSLRVQLGKEKEAMAIIGKEWEKLSEGKPLDSFVVAERFQQMYGSEERLSKIIGAFCLIAVFLSCFGLLAYTASMAQNRTKEIGIRKVNGAKVSEILTMLNKDFIKWIAIAFVVACPISYYAINKWLENFAYKTTLSWWIFALAGVLALGIALLTVSWQSLRAATRNPVEALRYE